MDNDINFALNILRNEYNERRKYLVEKEKEVSRKDNLLSDLEYIYASIIKIECKFNQ